MQKNNRPPTYREVSLELLPVCREKACRKVSRRLKRKVGSDDPHVSRKVREMERKMEERIKNIINLAQDPLSLEAPVGEDETTVGDLVACQESGQPQFMGEELKNLLSLLSEREKNILCLRYGLVDGASRTLQEISERFGISKERIRQKEEDALLKLRQVMKRKDWLD
jgi:RNA polymerase primary sigma factor